MCHRPRLPPDGAGLEGERAGPNFGVTVKLERTFPAGGVSALPMPGERTVSLLTTGDFIAFPPSQGG